jgi:prepilin-type processing-associated H-X9-DG protein
LNSRVRYDEITDGPAYTIMLGENSSGGPTLGWVSGTRSTLRNTGHPPVRATRSVTTIAHRSPRDEVFETIDALAMEGSWPLDDPGGFSSFHPLACNFLFCDGSVHPVRNSIDVRVYRQLGNRKDGELITNEAY